jgi:hypothetical protein
MPDPLGSPNSVANMEARIVFYRQVSEIYVKLTTPGILSKFPSDEEKEAFKELRSQWYDYVRRVQQDIMAVLLSELDANKVAFEQGITNLDQQLSQVVNAAQVLNTLESTLQLLLRIVSVV